MAASVDSLNIEIKADASKAAQSIDKLNTSLRLLGNRIESLNTSKVHDLANAINSISTVKIAGLVGELKILNQSLSEINSKLAITESLVHCSNDISSLTKSIQFLNSSLGAFSRKLTNMSSDFGRVGEASRNASSGLKLFVNSTSMMNKTTRSLAYSFGKFYGNFFLLIRGIKALWNGVKSSMDYVETYNYFKVTLSKMGSTMAAKMGDYGSDAAESYVDEFTSRLNELNKKMTGYETGANGELVSSGMANLGLDPNKLQQFQAKVGAIATSVGLIGDSASYAQKALSMLSADLSSLTNTDLDTVMTNLSSGMIGQSRVLYKYGIDITSAFLAQEALANGITKSVAEMTQADKMQLRLLVILKSSTIAWGDQANTINSVANQYRIFTQQVQNLGRVLGNLFLPIIQKVLPWVNGLIIALQRLFTTLGLKLWGDNWLTNLMDGISGGAASDIDDLGDELDDAAKSATKLKKALMGIDELNVISEDDSSSAALGSTIDLSSQIGDALSEYEKVWNKAFESMQNKAQYYADEISKTFDRLKEKFSPITDIWKSVDWDTIIQNLKDFWTAIQPYADEFGQGIINFFAKVSELFAEDLESILGKDGVLSNIIESLKNGDPEKAEKLGEAFATIATAVLAFRAGTAVASACATIATLVANWQLMLGFAAVVLTVTIVTHGRKYFEDTVALMKQYYTDSSELSEEQMKQAEKESSKKIWELYRFFAVLKVAWPYIIDYIQEQWQNLCNKVEDIWNTAIYRLKTYWNAFADMINSIHISIPPIEVAGKVIFEGVSWSPSVPTFDVTSSAAHTSSSGTSHGGSGGKFSLESPSQYSQFANGGGFENLVSSMYYSGQNSSTDYSSLLDGGINAILEELYSTRQAVSGLDLSVNIGDVEIAKANARGQKRIGATLLQY